MCLTCGSDVPMMLHMTHHHTEEAVMRHPIVTPVQRTQLHKPAEPHATPYLFGDTNDPHTIGSGAQKFAAHVQDAVRHSAGQRLAGTTRTV